MPRIHDVMAVHGVGEQIRGDTLSAFVKYFYKSVRQAALDAGQDPNREVKLIGRYQENYVEVHYQDEVFRVWEINWERSFKVPDARQVLSWLWQWSGLYLNWAYAQRKGHETQHAGRGPLPRTVLLLFVLLDLTLFVPLLATLYWLRAADKQVRTQKIHAEATDQAVIVQHRFATGLALALSVPLIMGLQILARLGHAGADLPFVGGLAARMARSIENLVVGSLGDGMLYIFDPIQAAFIRGDLEKVIEKAHAEAIDAGREPLIHVIGHSLGSVIAYEVVSHSLDPQIRSSVKTLCTMGTVLDMIRYILSSGGLVLSERVRFGQDLPHQQQGQTLPRWLNLYARNDPATGFGPLLEFGTNPANRPVRSTSKGHSTYWTDARGVHRPFLAWIVPGHPVLDTPPPPPALAQQSSILKDIATAFGKLALLILIVVGAAALLGKESANELRQLSQDATLPWPLLWLSTALAWLISSLTTLATQLPGWYLQWLLVLGGLLLLWVVLLGLPTWLRVVWRRFKYRRLVPLDQEARLDYWIDSLAGMGPDYVLALRKKGIWNVYDFIVAVARPGGPARLASLLDVSQEQVLQWARQANLMRLHGVGPQRAALLMAAGADSLTTLSQLERSTLMEQLASQLEQADLTRVPGGSLIKQWIERAKTLKDVV
jgi:hypothetical protein